MLEFDSNKRVGIFYVWNALEDMQANVNTRRHDPG